jgi:hypothetical protein
MHPVELENRLLAVWEKAAKLELSVYDAMDRFVGTRPISAPGDLRKMADSYLEIACELDAISRDLEAEVRTTQQRMSEVATQIVEGAAQIERDGLMKRLGKIVQMSRKPEK